MKLRLLEACDLETRVAWMNDVRVNNTLNIQLPVNLESTAAWFARIRSNDTREDYVFEEDGAIVAMGGFTDINKSVGKAELYIFVNPEMQGRGIGSKSVKLMCDYGFKQLDFGKIYLHTNSDNIAARRLYEKIGFTLEGYMPREIINNGKIKDRCYYGLYKENGTYPPQWREKSLSNDLSSFLLLQDAEVDNLRLKIVRDDLFPFIGGGNKGRKAVEYEKELRKAGCNAIVTTGGIQSNHNRAMALLAAKNGWECHLVYHGTKERFHAENGNALLVRSTNATTEFVEVDQISTAMNNAMHAYEARGLKPYYVTGGGHDIPGGLAYVNAVRQLYYHSQLNNYKPDYIFHASGTGSTQAGILVGLELVGWSDVKVIGISVARQKERGSQVVTEFANALAENCGLKVDFADRVHFVADYLYGGYEQFTPEMKDFLDHATRRTGIVFDTTYSGKAFYGMVDYIKQHALSGNCLFWHTGGIMNLMR